MKKISCLVLLVLMGCSRQKTAETLAVDTLQQDSLVDAVPDAVAITPPVEPEPQLDFKTITVEKNSVLEELAGYPFSRELDAMKALLDSLGISSQYENGENGYLSYDSAEISFNRSYGESICSADIRSELIALKRNIRVGMTLTEFMSLTGVLFSDALTLRYAYTHSAQEHNYKMQFDFVNKTLIRFSYEKDPCVIYD